MKKSITALLKMILTIFLVSALIIPQLGCGASDENYQGISKTGFYLNTVCQITVYGVKDEEGTLAAMTEDEQQLEIQKLITDAFLECDRYEKILSKTIENSDIYKINHAGGKTVTVSDTAIEVIKKGMEYGRISDGAFDITVGKAADLWNFTDVDENHEKDSPLPDESQLKEAVSHIDYRQIKIEGNQVTITDPEMEIDLGGIAKGYIADRTAEFLEAKGVVSAVVDLGGNIVVIGEKTGSLLPVQSTEGSEDTEGTEGDSDVNYFTVGITDPKSQVGELLGTLKCADKTVVTSGTYERYIEKDGIKYHHILDVKTGYPADTDVISVTIVSDKGKSVDCDGLSTTCLAIGVEAAVKLIQSIPDVEAVLVDTDGEITLTDENMGFQRY